MKRTLRQRARDMLSQAHLARHVLFHIYHTPAIPRHAAEIFGMSAGCRGLRDSGMTPITIAARGGKKRDGGARHAAHDPGQARRPGRAPGAMSTRQAQALFAEQDAGIDAYMRRHYRTPAQQVAFVCRLP